MLMRKGFDKHIRLSKEELNELRRKAQASCLNESALIRHLIMGFTPKEKPDDRFYDVMRELSSISNNINQLAAKANTLNFIDAPMLEKEVLRWHKFQSDVERTFLQPDRSSE